MDRNEIIQKIYMTLVEAGFFDGRLLPPKKDYQIRIKAPVVDSDGNPFPEEVSVTISATESGKLAFKVNWRDNKMELKMAPTMKPKDFKQLFSMLDSFIGRAMGYTCAGCCEVCGCGKKEE